MAFDNQSDGGAISQINVTPLVDVMLVLLVIFMVTAPILQQGVNVSLPRVEAAPLEGDGEELVVVVSAAGKVFLNETEMELAALSEKLIVVIGEQPAGLPACRRRRCLRRGDARDRAAARRRSCQARDGDRAPGRVRGRNPAAAGLTFLAL